MASLLSMILGGLGITQAPVRPERYDGARASVPVAAVSQAEAPVSHELNSEIAVPTAEVPASLESEQTPETSPDFEFDEEWYLQRYPDVAKVIRDRPDQTGR